MAGDEDVMRKPLARAKPLAPGGGDLWAIVLAGGEGVRLRPLVRLVCGDERPKQFAPLLEGRSLLEATLDRVRLGVPRERTVVVGVRHHAAYLREAREPTNVQMLWQPENRGTAAGILYAAHWVGWRDPDATLMVFPSDHFIGAERVFVGHVRRVATTLDLVPGRLVLVGARPAWAETEFGWIEPGGRLEPAHADVTAVRRFLEKPPPQVAEWCLAQGWLWNTLVLVAKVATLVETGRAALPTLHERLNRLRRFAGTTDEPWATRQAYALAPTASFSTAVLERCPGGLAVSTLPADVVWSDWGTPRRVLATVRVLGLHPPWQDALEQLVFEPHEDGGARRGRDGPRESGSVPRGA
jgi:mannose-1-phosphate guanylyltransferase